MSETQTLTRALAILFAIADTGAELSVKAIAERVSIPESTAYRLLRTLEHSGIVERRGKGQIGLGLKILDLARCLYQQIDRKLFIVAKPTMEELTKKTEETSILMVRTGLNAVCIQSVESPRAIRFSLNNGRSLPLHLSASGKAILAFETSKVIEHVVSKIQGKDRAGLTLDLLKIGQQGYSITVGEIDKDVMGIGVPVYDVYGRVMASLTIAGPAERLQHGDIQSLTQEVVEAARKITSNLTAVSNI